MLNTTILDACAAAAGDPLPIGALAFTSGPPFESQIDAASARLRYQTLQLLAKAKRQSGHDTASVHEELASMRERMPTYVTALVLTGAVRVPMYDAWPNLAHFYSPVRLCIALPRLSASQVQQHVTAALLRRARRRWVTRFGRHSQTDDRFCMLDMFGRVVMIGELKPRQRGRGRQRRSVSWLPLPDPSAVDAMKQQAARYDDEASLERGWDNFSTAQHLNDLAAALRDSVSCVQYGINLVP